MVDLQVNFEQLKCAQCKRYLSVPPIHHYLDTNGDEKSVCGRCQVPQHQITLRSDAFETVAQHLQFPCSYAPQCSKKLTWKVVKKHESWCEYRPITCPICEQGQIALKEMVSHFKENHRNHLFENNRLSIDGSLFNFPCLETSLVVLPGAYYVISIRKFAEMHGLDGSSTFFKPVSFISVIIKSLDKTMKHKLFELTFSTEFHSFTVKNKPIIKGQTTLEYRMRTENIETLFQEDSSKGMKLELHIDEGTNDRKAKNASENESEKTLQEIRSLLECLVCTQPMIGRITICNQGHSICQNCRARLQSCPSCRSDFANTRNITLEQISEKIIGRANFRLPPSNFISSPLLLDNAFNSPGHGHY